MQRNAALILALLLAANGYADGLSRLISTNRTSGTGTLRTGSIMVATNTGAVSFYVGNRGSNAVKVGVEGVADTNAINTAVANRAVTNAWNTMTLAITNAPPTGTNLVLWTDDATNLYWKAWP